MGEIDTVDVFKEAVHKVLARLLAVAGPLPGSSVAQRIAALPHAAAHARPAAARGDDDVVDPIGRPAAVYRRSFEQMLPAVDAIAAALGGR